MSPETAAFFGTSLLLVNTSLRHGYMFRCSAGMVAACWSGLKLAAEAGWL